VRRRRVILRPRDQFPGPSLIYHPRMTITELRCPGCSAPVDPSLGRAVRCPYCSASLVVQASAAATRRETFVVRLVRVGPSNRARVAKLLVASVRLAEDEAHALVARAPCEVVTWEEPDRAEFLCEQLVEAGAEATVETRVVEIPAPPVLPARDITLEDVGPNKVAVMKVLRDHLSVELPEAKRLVESTPRLLVEGWEGARATAFLEDLRAVGARVRAD